MRISTSTAPRRSIRKSLCLSCALLAFAVFLLPGSAEAQPYGAWIILDDSDPGYIDIPHSPALNPTNAFTFEAWINIGNDTNCRSLAGKGWQETWWVGICGSTVRTYLKGGSSVRDAGVLPIGQWTHVAVTYDGAMRKHYVNGILEGSWAEAGPLPSNTANMRIGSDVSWNVAPNATMDEVRLWNVARTQEQIRDAINDPFSSPMPGLVGVWAMNGATEELGNHDGSLVGTTPFLTFPVGTGCIPGELDDTHCFFDRFIVDVEWETGGGATGEGTVVPGFSERSGLFWFFAADNWEMLVKMVNGCANNGHYWFFAAATTNVFYRLEVFDITAGVNKIYFNYQGESAVSVTDNRALATCP